MAGLRTPEQYRAQMVALLPTGPANVVACRRNLRSGKGARAGCRRRSYWVQLNLALSSGQVGYPANRTGALLHSINFKVSRAGFLVKVAPRKTSAMKAFYPAYLHYGVKQGGRLKPLAPGKGKGKSNRRAKGDRAAALAQRASGGWGITPGENYVADALQVERSTVQSFLRSAFGEALFA